MSINSNFGLLCPCSSKNKYSDCCEKFHNEKETPNALELMRSRFCAFAMGKISYIIATSTSQTDYEDLKKFSDNCDFIHLDIMEYTFEKTQSFVTFRATIKCSEKDCSFVEKSRFVRNSKGNKGWLYADGEFIKY